MGDLIALGGLFLAAFLAATILPAQSEAALVGLILAGGQPVWLLVLVASIGNVAGSVLNWWIGRGAHALAGRRWSPVTPENLARAEGWYRRFGRWSLLLAWVPVIGDPLTVAAGLLREPMRTFLPLVAIGKVGRYVVLAIGTIGLTGP